MKKLTLLLAFIACVLVSQVQAQTQSLPLIENFPYAAGTGLIGQAGWIILGTSTVNALVTTAPGSPAIAYLGYHGSEVGNEVSVANNGQDIADQFTPQYSGTIYYSVLVNTSAAQTGDYFLTLGEPSSSSFYLGRLYVKLDGAKIAFGILNNSGGTYTVTYTTSIYDLNVTYLAVVKVDVITGTSSLIINPAIRSSEPAAAFWITSSSPANGGVGGTNIPTAAGIGEINIRQGSSASAPTLRLDGLRVGQSWSSIFLGIDTTAPYIQLAPNLLNGFTYDKGAGPSAEQTFSLVGYNLTSDITIAPPINFQISKTSGSGFTSLPIILTQNAGSVDITTIYVRLKAGLNFDNYTDSILVSSNDATIKKVYCSGTVVGPTITPSITSLSNLNYNKGLGPSAEQSFSISGSVLESDIILTPSANLQLSKTSGSGFVGTPITLTQSAGIINSTNIYVRLKAGLNFANYLVLLY